MAAMALLLAQLMVLPVAPVAPVVLVVLMEPVQLAVAVVDAAAALALTLVAEEA